jgi:Zn-dependent M28 family amino/carboxypeptidase
MAFKQGTNWWRLFVDCLAAAWNMVRMPGRSHRGPLPPPDERLLTIAAELRRHVTKLAEEIGERNIRYRPRELALTADYVEAELSSAGYEVQRQEYAVDGTTYANLEVELPGTSKASDIVIIGAHYDSVPNCPAANDNGSGVAALLSLARTFAGSKSARTLRFVAFVNEEAPYAHTPQMGSWVYARRCRQRGENVTAMLSLETIGYYTDEPKSQRYPPALGWFYPSTGDFIAFVGNTRYGELVRDVMRAFRKSEPFPCQGGAMPEAISDIGRSDHWPFWREGYPALMVTDTAPFRYPHYHTPEDTVDKIDFERTARVVRGLESVIRRLAAADSRP